MIGGDVWNRHFEWNGLTGVVEVECIPNTEPASYGTIGPVADGFPVCTATVRYARRGYESMFGWVQLVRSTDNASGGHDFEPDPFALFGDARSPYCWYGTEPTLFDAPSRVADTPLVWLSYSFLATTPLREVLSGNPRRVVPVVGFRWGFERDANGAVELYALDGLSPDDWRDVVPVLRAAYPSPLWTFADAM